MVKNCDRGLENAYLFQIVEVKIFFGLSFRGANKTEKKITWLDGSFTRKFPLANMIKYSLENLLFTQVKRAQPHVVMQTRIFVSVFNNGANWVKHKTLFCFNPHSLHICQGDVINTKSAEIKKACLDIQVNFNFETHRKNIMKIYDLSSVILY